jgi:hypothetical protein
MSKFINATPAWSDVMPILLAAAERGSDVARDEIKRLAAAVDHIAARDDDVVYIVKGTVTDDDGHYNTGVGDVEWQFSDGPPGERSFSSDYTSLEEGLSDHSGKRFVWVDSTKEANA